VFGVGPLAQGGLDETFGLAVGSRRIRPGAMVFELAQRAGMPELAGAITGAVVGQQSADPVSLASDLGPLVAINSGPSVAVCWTR